MVCSNVPPKFSSWALGSENEVRDVVCTRGRGHVPLQNGEDVEDSRAEEMQAFAQVGGRHGSGWREGDLGKGASLLA